MKDKTVFRIPVGNLSREKVELAVAEMTKLYKQEVTVSYQNKETGEVAEYDAFMGLYYIKGKENHPYANWELRDSPDWELVIDLWLPLEVDKDKGFFNKLLKFLRIRK